MRPGLFRAGRVRPWDRASCGAHYGALGAIGFQRICQFVSQLFYEVRTVCHQVMAFADVLVYVVKPQFLCFPKIKKMIIVFQQGRESAISGFSVLTAVPTVGKMPHNRAVPVYCSIAE